MEVLWKLVGRWDILWTHHDNNERKDGRMINENRFDSEKHLGIASFSKTHWLCKWNLQHLAANSGPYFPSKIPSLQSQFEDDPVEILLGTGCDGAKITHFQFSVLAPKIALFWGVGRLVRQKRGASLSLGAIFSMESFQVPNHQDLPTVWDVLWDFQ